MTAQEPTINTASWVVVCRETGRAIFETFMQETAQAVNQERYRVVPVMEYLQEFNASIK